MPHTCDVTASKDVEDDLDLDDLYLNRRRLGRWHHPHNEEYVRIGGQQFRTHEHGGGLVSLHAVVAPTVYIAANAMVKDRAIC